MPRPSEADDGSTFGARFRAHDFCTGAPAQALATAALRICVSAAMSSSTSAGANRLSGPWGARSVKGVRKAWRDPSRRAGSGARR